MPVPDGIAALFTLKRNDCANFAGYSFFRQRSRLQTL